MPAPVRSPTAVPICDGHDSAINTINLEFIRHGIEVVYLGFHRYVKDIVRAAIQEDVAAVGISSYNGGHIEFFAEVVKQLKKRGADDIKVFGGGGGTITHDDQRIMQNRGVDKIFFAGTSLTGYEAIMCGRITRNGTKARGATSDPEMNSRRKLTEIEDSYANGKRAKNIKIENRESKFKNTKVIGFTGPGGAGKTTLVRRTGFASAASRAKRGSRFFHTIRASSAKARCWRSRDDDQLAGRSRFHAQHGDARTIRRFVARDGRLPATARAKRFRLRHHRNRWHGPGSDAVSK